MSEKEKNIGALWMNETKSGKPYLKGMIEIGGEKHNIVVFKNGFKKADKHPDYQIFPSVAKGEAKREEEKVPFF